MNVAVNALLASLFACLAVLGLDAITNNVESRTLSEWLLLFVAVFAGIYLGLWLRNKQESTKAKRK